MLRSLIFIIFFIPFLAKGQNDLLILKKRGANVHTYTVGSEILLKTVYDQWFSGHITLLRHDTVWINGLGFHYKEIAQIRRSTTNFANTTLAVGMMAAGAGSFILGAVNGWYRHDQSKDWYTKSGVITASSLLVAGFLLTRTTKKVYRIGRRYKLEYLQLTFDKQGNIKH